MSQGVHGRAAPDTWRVRVRSAGTEAVRGSARDRTVQRALALADRELSADEPVVLSSDPAGTVPPVGSLDLAVDATGATAGEVARQLAERLHLREPDPARARERLRRLRLSLTVAVLGVNRAAEPGELIELCGELAERGARQLLVFDGGVAGRAGGAGGGGHGGPAALRRGAREALRVRYRTGRLRERLEDLSARITALPPEADRDDGPSTERGDPAARPPADRVTRLWEELAGFHRAYRATATPPPAARLHAVLDRLGERVGRVEELTAARQAAADRLRTRRAALREELETYRLLAARQLRVEDVELAPRYHQAYRALRAGPFAPDAAAASVARYTSAVRAALGWPPATEEDD